MSQRRKRKRKPRKTVFEIKIRQGVVHITANGKSHAEMQARAFERDVSRYWVRQQTEIEPGVFALGTEAKTKLGVEVYSCDD